MTTITVDHVSRYYTLKDGKTVQALNDVTLQIKDGDTLAILGPSGSGKTTLLRLIAGLETPDKGKIQHNGMPLYDMPLEERNIGMVFQEYALIPHWESERNIGFFLRLRRRQREVPERVEMVSRITGVGIQHLMGKFPRELSGGEKQRVAIARAFARDLQLLLFDEPFANLDAKFRATARTEARRLLDKFPVTTIYVTHDQQEAAVMGEKIIIMRDGHIEQIGDYQSLYYDPANRFVAEFIGEQAINMFDGVMRDGQWTGAPFGDVPLPVVYPNGSKITLGIRPEHIFLAGDTEATVTDITPFFSKQHQLLEVTDGTIRWEMRAPLDQPFTAGQTVHCAIRPDDVMLFDTVTGERLD